MCRGQSVSTYCSGMSSSTRSCDMVAGNAGSVALRSIDAAALSRLDEPDPCTTTTSITRPDRSTSTCSATVPCSLRRRAASGYRLWSASQASSAWRQVTLIGAGGVATGAGAVADFDAAWVAGVAGCGSARAIGCVWGRAVRGDGFGGGSLGTGGGVGNGDAAGASASGDGVACSTGGGGRTGRGGGAAATGCSGGGVAGTGAGVAPGAGTWNTTAVACSSAGGAGNVRCSQTIPKQPIAACSRNEAANGTRRCGVAVLTG
jgi:hypothetical protein